MNGDVWCLKCNLKRQKLDATIFISSASSANYTTFLFPEFLIISTYIYSRNCCIFHFCFGIFLFPSFPWLFRRAVGFQSTIFSMFKGSPCHEVKFLQDGLVVKYFSVVDTYLPPWYLNGWIMKPLESLGQPLYISLFAKIQHKTHKTNLNCTVF